MRDTGRERETERDKRGGFGGTGERATERKGERRRASRPHGGWTLGTWCHAAIRRCRACFQSTHVLRVGGIGAIAAGAVDVRRRVSVAFALPSDCCTNEHGIEVANEQRAWMSE